MRVSSPYAAVEQSYLACKSVKSKVWLQVIEQVRLKIQYEVKHKIRFLIERLVESKIQLKVWSQLKLQIDGSQINFQIWFQINSPSKDYYLYSGAFWAAEAAFISFFRDILNWQAPILENFKIFEDLVISCGGLWWHEDVLVISDRPEKIYLDNQGRLHSESGPALVYRDGWSVWSWHGFSVPQLVIERPQDITVEMIDSESNAEIRRIMIDRFGDRGAISYLLAGDSTILDHDERWGTLYYRNIPNDEPVMMIKVINKTPELDGSFKHYFLRVPPDIDTAHEAVAWSFGKVPGQFPILGQRRQGDVLIERYDSDKYYPESES